MQRNFKLAAWNLFPESGAATKARLRARILLESGKSCLVKSYENCETFDEIRSRIIKFNRSLTIFKF